MRILLIEDETGIANLIREGLEEANYKVDVAADGQTGLRMACEQTYHLILLDIMLPGRDGWSVCEELRARRDRVPILMLTARDGVRDRVRGLDAGADDYLPKPFDFQELMARVRALLRRDKIHRTRVIRVADLEIDTAQHRVTRAGVVIPLSHREYDLLEALAAHEGKVLTRDIIQERIWMNEEATYNTVNVYIGMLRKKIDAEHKVKLIHTVHGVGYTLRVSEGETT
ncbi:MAG TPA: response regulator transcription factor [Chthonomonadaceae bacterium]|nr:response regulator transcription factor [Chthonomonadaceae bacterium]